MRCTNCGYEVNQGELYCPSCGAAMPQPQYQQPQQHYQQPQYQQPQQAIDTPSGLLNALGCLFPIVGLIMYLVMKGTTPIKAKGVGKWAIIGMIVSVVITIFAFILVFTMIGSLASLG